MHGLGRRRALLLVPPHARDRDRARVRVRAYPLPLPLTPTLILTRWVYTLGPLAGAVIGGKAYQLLASTKTDGRK